MNLVKFNNVKQALIYSLKVWFTTACLGPFITGIVLIITDPQVYSANDIVGEGLVYSLLTAIVGLVACILPCLLFAWLLHLLYQKEHDTKRLKGYLTIISLLLILLPFFIIEGRVLLHPNYWPSILPWILTYSLLTILAIWFYKLKPIKQSEGEVWLNKL